MPDNSLSTLIFYLIGAIVLGAATLFAVGMFVEVHKYFNRWLLPLISPLLLLAIGVGVVLSHRDITNAETEIGTFDTAITNTEIWMLRLAMLLVLGICTAIFISASQRHEPAMKQGRSLFIAFMLYFITNNVLNNLLGTSQVIDQKLAYSALIFSAAFIRRDKDVTPFLDATKWGLLLLMIGGYVAAVLKPSLAIQPYSDSVLPGISFRMWGLGSNPNSIGPLALILLLLLLHRPFRHRLPQFAACAVAVGVLVLAQSKTTWIAALFSLPIFWWSRTFHAATRTPNRSAMRPVLISLFAFGLICVLMYGTLHPNLVSRVADDHQLTTLTGRTEIWNAAIQTWQHSPLFGYGSSAWDSAFRNRIGMDFAYSAHNQFLQSLSCAGLLGFAGLLIYLLMLGRYALAANAATGGLSLALAATIFVRLFTEVPLDIDGVFSGDFITHLLLFSLILTKGQLPARVHFPYARYAPMQQHFPQQ